MKVQTKITNEYFNPIKIEITFEEKEEIECFCSIMNHSAICDAAKPFLSLQEIKDVLQTHHDRFNYRLVFDKFADKLQGHPCIASHYEQSN